jgi:cholinesterase
MKSTAAQLLVTILGMVVSSYADVSARQTRNWTVGQSVKTSSGVVSGHASGNLGLGVSEYLGIPFAAPPIGDLRFAPPQAFVSNGSAISGDYLVCPKLLHVPWDSQ